ncbi:hypothetical protein NBRC116583_12770 [Arenicella sp. 4NH20-0111]|uniref:hypothetical protein n=1 Tax=Arenicella sp. 4NH20-0111 TaxID=3127648 RepID=UPI00310699C1
MNFGLALAKPGESSLGLAGRLWQANLGAWRFDSVFINQRIDQEIAQNHRKEFKGIGDDAKGLDALKAFERHHFPDQPRANLPRYLKTTKAVRHCFVCAQSRYHSIYFNMPWIEECPIHEGPLLIVCPTCNKQWPSADDVHKRVCETCGIRRKSGSPTRLELFGSDEYEVIRELDVFFSQEINIGKPEWIHMRHLSTPRIDMFAKTLLYPSVLVAHLSEKGSRPRIPEAIDPSIQLCQHKRFKFKPAVNWNEYICDEKIKKMGQIRQKAIRSVLKNFQKLVDHPLGSCERDEGTGRFKCIDCECHWQISSAFYEYASRHNPLASYYLPGIGKERFLDPGLVQVIRDTRSERFFRVPDSIQWLLYELDIKSCIRRLALQLYYSNPSKRSSLGIDQQIEDDVLCASQSPYTNYYYFVIEGDYCHLYYPNEYDDIYFFEFENWLSIMRSF